MTEDEFNQQFILHDLPQCKCGRTPTIGQTPLNNEAVWLECNPCDIGTKSGDIRSIRQQWSLLVQQTPACKSLNVSC